MVNVTAKNKFEISINRNYKVIGDNMEFMIEMHNPFN